MSVARLITVFSLALFVVTSSAADCRKTGAVCVDATPCKVVSGVQVCLTQLGQSCWRYEDTYSCLKPNSINYCQSFVSAQPACWQTSAQCVQADTQFGTGCMRYTQTWRCGDPNTPTPANTTKLADTYTLVSSDYDTSECAGVNEDRCQVAQSVCTSTTPTTPLPPGIDAADAAPDGCYERTTSYACFTGRSDSSECDALASNPDCSFKSAICEDEIGETLKGQCTFETKTYSCMTEPPKTNTVTDCGGRLFCQGENCFDTEYEPDTDFARSMALMEAAREAGVYGGDVEIFKGFGSRCKVKLFGLVNCCKSKGGGGGMSNSAMALSAAGGTAQLFGSPYMYDAMFATDAPWLMDRAIDAWGANAWTGATSFYGFQFSFSPVAGLQYVGFDPYTFALQIGMMILSDILSCEQNEQILALKRGQRLCQDIGSYCSKKMPVIGTCIERTKSYCCYNSRLARIINQQGRAQIGRGWGSAKSPDCSGFTPEQFAAIDFSQMDLSEFTAEIMANIKMPDVGSMNQAVEGSVQQKVLNYYDQVP